jgi:leucyl/phenylalanyl-tRNA--protein transferase
MTSASNWFMVLPVVHAPFASPPIEPRTLLLAYRSGIFPMADARHDAEIFWVEPRRRAILPLEGFRMARSLARTLRRERFAVTCNRTFAGVVQACAAPRLDGGATWISTRIEESYIALHHAGHAHSIECWQGTQLVGGLYGVGFDRVFCGESMFSLVPDASKAALAWLVAALRRAGVVLLDCQFMTDHLASLGAIEIDQAEYLERLRAAQVSAEGAGSSLVAGSGNGLELGASDGAGAALDLPAGFAALLGDAAAAGSSSSPGNFIAQSLTQTS